MKLDLQPFMFLPPPQVFLAENLYKTSSKNRTFVRFLGRTYKALYNERCLIMSDGVMQINSTVQEVDDLAQKNDLSIKRLAHEVKKFKV